MGAIHIRAALAALLFVLAVPAPAQDAPLRERVEQVLREAGPGTRFGLVVMTMDGREIVSIAPDDRFAPASNTKLISTAVAFDMLPYDQPDRTGGAAVRLDEEGGGPPDVVLIGHGDTRLSSAAECVANCLAMLADAVAARVRTVDDVIGDDSLFPDERWGPGMSWEDIPTRSGTAASALNLDDNELHLRVSPGAVGERPEIAGYPYFTIDNRVTTVASGGTDLAFDRLPNSRDLRITGTIAAGAEPALLRLGIDDPAHFAAWRLKALLEARGVRVVGGVAARHRPLSASDDPAARKGTPVPRPPQPEALAKLTPPPLKEDLALTNKVSQNLHAELLLRRAGHVAGSGSIADGVAAAQAMLDRAGVERWRYHFADGSGMSTYNRISPRGLARFLRWTVDQPWGAAYRETLPIGGVDGTLKRRFAGTPLEGRVFAKTGTLTVASALSGFMTAASGQTLIFSSFANDMPRGAAATRAVDAALNLIAAEN
ncbi:D-alanyl-D-alanine carboxypeptidase/D-alanyl-D-alanine-endopeptidase [Sphingomonas gilva]|uniref:D-alanyl-D-alanine carboxypeptidase/D-alanyl-D-alanine-endopeptidase n=1 Tax=Sphingomonas gilva TaxID=2305907 RepID=A0A396RRA7_9SPHN|nr:D-alanyl-D-alanine carboxypeptidase/D-alanyl-D-alanine-endopeptidase [Sphingomonas gilva]RHW19070.1 D-alanyl-D-alanine carboxypeptidase/D-alanyl-D-alanine-endopeptidase [Sphingomonas gilva]